ncbi:sensor histidine kinase [Actinospica robiniae]|uniref:sensor histidine kinase n=1 Tax=Actinospica robiniae TaxID=304901 RepID=UPI00041926CD|nr:nitrate- and nitrite sensing domain-containing protein [Actinospica robiniae]
MRNRLFLLVCFPLVIAIGVAATRVNTLYQDRSHLQHARFQAGTAAQVEQLLLTIQQERQAAAVCVAMETGGSPCVEGSKTNPNPYYVEFEDAIGATTQTVEQLTPIAESVAQDGSFAAQLRAAAAEALGRAQDLGAIRKSVTTQAAVYTVTFNSYSGVIDDVMAVLAATAAGTSDQSVTQDNQALSALNQMIESESIAEVITDQVYAAQGALSPELVQNSQAQELQDALASYDSAQQSFDTTASQALVQSYDSTVSGPLVSGASAGVTSALAVVQDSKQGQFGVNNPIWVNSTNNISDGLVNEDLPGTIGDLRSVQALAIDQMVDDSQSLLNAADSDLYLNIGIIIFALLLSFLGTLLVARSLTRPLGMLRAAALEIAATRLPEMVRRLRDADAATADANSRVEPIPITSSDEIGEVARSFDEVHQQAVRLASEQAMLRANVNSMFVNLSRRSQSLVQRQLRLIDELENSEQDPDQLASLFKLDHLATRMRRNGENLLVLAGEEPGRKWSQAVRLLDVLRAGASEVEQYERVALHDLPDTNVVGRVVNDLVHLVAELLENATSFSAPETKVTVTANTLNTGGVMLEIEDSGIGMTPEELDDANERLANPPVIDVAISRRMGLYVVGRLATRHGIQVRLRRSAGGGITALVLVPSSLLAGVEGEQVPATELSATGVRNLGALPRRGALPSEPLPTYDDPLESSFGGGPRALAESPSAGLGGLPPAPLDEFEPGSSGLGGRPAGSGSIPGARSPMDEAPPATRPAPPVGPPVNPFAAQPPREEPAPAPFEPPFGPPSAPAAPPAPPFGADAPFGPPAGAQPGLSAPAAFGSEPPAPGNPFRAAPRAELGLDGSAQGLQQPPLPPPFPPAEPAKQAPPVPPQPPAMTQPLPQVPAAPPQAPPTPPPTRSESTGQLPRIRDVGNTGQFPAVGSKGPGAPRHSGDTGQIPVVPRSAAPNAPVAPQRRASDDTAQFRLNPQADPAGSGSFSVADRLFASDPLPPAPATDERLPIFEAMESEWFRRRDEARAQAAQAASQRPTGFAGPAERAPVPTPAPQARVRPAEPQVQPQAEARSVEPLEQAPAFPTPPTVAPETPAAPVPNSAGDRPMETPPPSWPTSSASAAEEVRAPEGARGNSGSWSSPGDEGWRAAQAAAKPVAAGLTQKGLPKRVPKSNLVPGSAGGTGAAKATPPPMAPRSAEEVRGRLSSFHRGLRQGRDAATGQDTNPSEGER